MNLTNTDIGRLLKKWAASSEIGMSEEEYEALVDHAAAFTYRHLAFVFRTKKNDRLREHVRDEVIARGLLRSPMQDVLLWVAVVLGLASSIATLGSFARELARDRGLATPPPAAVAPHTPPAKP
jgi:hypothetical protein